MEIGELVKSLWNWGAWRAWGGCGASGDLVQLVKVLELGDLVQLGARNIKQSLHLEGKCFFSCFQNEDDKL